MEDKILIEPELHIKAMFCVHYLDNGEEQWLDEDEFNRVDVYDGKTYVEYYTGWEDCLYDGFYVTETKEEVLELVKETRRRAHEAYEKYEILSQND